jgi:hypothetical protein
MDIRHVVLEIHKLAQSHARPPEPRPDRADRDRKDPGSIVVPHAFEDDEQDRLALPLR